MRKLMLAAALVVVLAAAALLVARHLADPHGYSRAFGNRVVDYTLTSRLLGRQLAEIAIVPRGSGRRGLLVFLHGRHDPAPWSMGGYGALHLASIAPTRFCAVGGHSPALWTEPGLSPPGAFDDRDDFERNDVFAAARAGRFDRLPIWIDGGSADPFRGADADLVALLRNRGASVEYHVWPGAHTHEYWASHMRAYLRFYAQALAACR